MIFRFCPRCAAQLRQITEDGQLRSICDVCGYIQYRNPTVGVAVVLLKDDLILLGRRSPTSSYAGLWCIPCGHVEWDEDVRSAAIREFAEETGLQAHLGDLVAVHSNFHNQEEQTVGVWFRGFVEQGELRAADDLDSVAYFPLREPPPMAFPSDELVLAQLRQSDLRQSMAP